MKLEDLNNADSMKFVLSASGTDPAFKITFEENKEITSVHVAPRYVSTVIALSFDNALFCASHVQNCNTRMIKSMYGRFLEYR